MLRLWLRGGQIAVREGDTSEPEIEGICKDRPKAEGRCMPLDVDVADADADIALLSVDGALLVVLIVALCVSLASP